MNLVTPNGAAENERFFNKLPSELGLLNKNASLASALGVTKLITIIGKN